MAGLRSECLMKVAGAKAENYTLNRTKKMLDCVARLKTKKPQNLSVMRLSVFLGTVLNLAWCPGRDSNPHSVATTRT